MSGAALVCLSPTAVEYLKLILTGHCYLMMDNLQEAYTAYQQALYYLRDPKVPPGAIPGRASGTNAGSGAETLVRNWYPV